MASTDRLFWISIHSKLVDAIEKRDSWNNICHVREEQKSPWHKFRVFEIESFPNIQNILGPHIRFNLYILNPTDEVLQSRYFLVMTFHMAFCLLKMLPEEARCLYEIIGGDECCWMYFDIEREYDEHFTAEQNDAIMQDFKNELIKDLKSEYKNIFRSKLYKYFVDMDSSTSTKMSHHLLLRPVNKSNQFIIWENNQNLGAYVKAFLSRLFNNVELRRKFFYPTKKQQSKNNFYIKVDQSENRLNKNMGMNEINREKNGEINRDINGENNEETVSVECWQSIVDISVYTKNRAFRIVGNSKKGKNSYLKITEQTYKEYKYNDNSLISNPKPIIPIKGAQWFFRSLVTSIPLQKQYYQTLKHETYEMKSSRYFSPNHNSPNLNFQISELSQNYKKEFGNLNLVSDSALRNYIIEHIQIIQSVKLQGSHYNIPYISKCEYIKNFNQIRYYIGGNRFCYNINREHKSNHVYYIVDLNKQEFFQKCNDPDCRKFRSTHIPIPSEYMPKIYNTDTNVASSSLPPDDNLEMTELSQLEFNERKRKRSSISNSDSDSNYETKKIKSSI